MGVFNDMYILNSQIGKNGNGKGPGRGVSHGLVSLRFKQKEKKTVYRIQSQQAILFLQSSSPTRAIWPPDHRISPGRLGGIGRWLG